MLLKVPVLVKKGQIALSFGIYHCWSGVQSCQSKESFISATAARDETQVSLLEAAKKQKQRWGESDVPVGLRRLQERQSCGQLSSAFLKGLDKHGQPAAVQSILPRGSGGATKLLGCRLLPAMGATDEPAVHLSGASCVGRAAPLLNIRQGWRVSREKDQRGGLEVAKKGSRVV